ncbi:MAG: hypothetical protein BMS9Abin05_1165 [Rhodothermia bacterium]|nr:MAG: hypothetical protein BMS9Abin05_1165 [Rhodothermia bacterium]
MSAIGEGVKCPSPVSVDGGQAELLTFGPFYDKEPVIAPDGRRIAFVSERDGSNGNIHVLDL